MAELTVNVPDSAFAIAMVTVALDGSGKPTIVTATEYPHDELESLGKASLPTALRRLADDLQAANPRGVVTLPNLDEDDDWDDEDEDYVDDHEEHDNPTEKKD